LKKSPNFEDEPKLSKIKIKVVGGGADYDDD
jgi:hypothetical protein